MELPHAMGGEEDGNKNGLHWLFGLLGRPRGSSGAGGIVSLRSQQVVILGHHCGQWYLAPPAPLTLPTNPKGFS